MGYNFAAADRDQLFLLPPDPRDWLPPGHLAWAVLGQVAGMDLAPFLAWYRADGQGRRAYHPELMVALVLYCYCKGIRSSRAVEMATFDDVGARVICGNLHPDHATVARFVTRHEGPVKGLLVQSLVACARQGLVSVEVVAGDGTKVKANASMTANATAARLEIEIAELEALLAAEADRWLAQARAADAAEDALSGGDDRGPGAGGGTAAMSRLAGKIDRRRRARARLDAEQRARQARAEADRAEKITRLQARVARHQANAAREAAAADARVTRYQARGAAKAAAGNRRRPRGRVPVPADRNGRVRREQATAAKARQALDRVLATPAAPAAPARPPKASTTDPASAVMPAKYGGYAQAHNVQVLATTGQVILGIGTCPSPVDTSALHPLLAAGRANLTAAGITQPIGTALFDAGYASDANFTAPCEASLYVSVTRESRQTGRLRDGRKRAATKASWHQMAAKLATPQGQALYKQRAGTIEPIFAQLFARLGRDLHYRDTKTSLELHLWAASHNYLKAIRARTRAMATT
jgi:transposase